MKLFFLSKIVSQNMDNLPTIACFSIPDGGNRLHTPLNGGDEWLLGGRFKWVSV
jgi:hypothetical protein